MCKSHYIITSRPASPDDAERSHAPEKAISSSSYAVEEGASIIERLQGFVAEDKHVIGTATALLAVGVVAHQYHVASVAAGSSRSGRGEVEMWRRVEGQGAASEAGSQGR